MTSCGAKNKAPVLLKYASKSELKRCLPQKKKSKDRFLYHTLKPGETLYRLTRIYNTTVDELIELNQIADINDIPTGTVLKIKNSGDIYNTGKLSWPAKGQLTSKYGWRKRNFHYGIDIANKKGTKIVAASDGFVILSGNNIRGFSGYGKVIALQHSDNLITLYAHNNKNYVSEGQCVRRNQSIGQMGRTGNATGTHLHFEVRKDKSPVNPINYLK